MKHARLGLNPRTSESEVLVLFARALTGSKDTQCTQFTQNELCMPTNRTGPVYCQIDKDSDQPNNAS